MGTTEDEVVGWHHQLNGYGLRKLQETVKGREAWPAGVYVVAKSLGTTEQLNNNTIEIVFLPPFYR